MEDKADLYGRRRGTRYPAWARREVTECQRQLNRRVGALAHQRVPIGQRDDRGWVVADFVIFVEVVVIAHGFRRWRDVWLDVDVVACDSVDGVALKCGLFDPFTRQNSRGFRARREGRAHFLAGDDSQLRPTDLQAWTGGEPVTGPDAELGVGLQSFDGALSLEEASPAGGHGLGIGLLLIGMPEFWVVIAGCGPLGFVVKFRKNRLMRTTWWASTASGVS